MFLINIQAIHERINAPNFISTPSSSVPIEKHIQLMSKVEMLNIYCINIMSKLGNFSLIVKLKIFLLLAHVGITQQKHNKVKIANMK
jgi:hypothetical protein